MAHKQSSQTSRENFAQMSKDELLRVIARYYMCFRMDEDSRVVYQTDAWAHLSKSHLIDLAQQCR